MLCNIQNSKIRRQTAYFQVRRLIMSHLTWIYAVYNFSYFIFGALRAIQPSYPLTSLLLPYTETVILVHYLTFSHSACFDSFSSWIDSKSFIWFSSSLHMARNFSTFCKEINLLWNCCVVMFLDCILEQNFCKLFKTIMLKNLQGQTKHVFNLRKLP